MSAVITREQATAITRGRTPLVPVEYEEAVRALDACISLDDAKYWSDKSDALAAWAKIYHSDKVQRQARILKLKAFRRMGELAEQLRPTKGGAPVGQLGGRTPGAVSLLKENGLGNNEIAAIRRITKLPTRSFEKILDRPKVPTPFTAIKPTVNGTDAYNTFVYYGSGPSGMRSFCRKHPAKELARGLSVDEAAKAREVVNEISEWLDEFEQNLKR